MDSSERKKVAVIAKYIIESFSDSDWYSLGQVTGKLKVITDHPRLFRSLSFGDEDYPYCVAEVLDTIFSGSGGLIPEVIDYFDIDLWYQQKDPAKHKKIFISSSIKSADFWKDGYVKIFGFFVKWVLRQMYCEFSLDVREFCFSTTPTPS